MEEFSEYSMFLKPERPILMHFSILGENHNGWAWLGSEEELVDCIADFKRKHGTNFVLEEVFEVGSVREIKVGN